MSQERLAELCGPIGVIERAERTLTIVAADELAKALGITLSQPVP